jgi:hypothetical protein
MILRRRLLAPLFVAVAALVLTAMPAIAEPAAGIDDEGFDEDAPGAVIVRQVETSNSVIVRLNNNFRSANFRIVVRGVDVVGVDDDFSGSIGLEGEWDDGIVGPCRDELLVADWEPGAAKTKVAKAKFRTCEGPDTIRIHLGDAPEFDPSSGVDAAIKIVFVDLQKLDNVEGVFVGLDPTNVGESWVPLYEEPGQVD